MDTAFSSQISASAVGGRYLPRPSSLVEREILWPTGCRDALTYYQTQCTPDRRDKNSLLSRDADAGHHIGGRVGRVMRDLKMRSTTAAPLPSPRGLAFEIADLLLVRSWADLRDCRMSVRLDHGTDDEEYEEVIAFEADTSSDCQLIIWRNAVAVFVQPLIGRMRRYGSVAEVLDGIDLKPRIVLTDITATSWPTG
jgi:hypothetical protein